jgi:hypothetical protein
MQFNSLFCWLIVFSIIAVVNGHGWLESVGGVKANYANWPGGRFMPPFHEFFDQPCVLPTSDINSLPRFTTSQNVSVVYFIRDPDDLGYVQTKVLYSGGSAVVGQSIPVPNVILTTFTDVVTLPGTPCTGCVFQWTWTLPTSTPEVPQIYYGCVPMNIENSGNTVSVVSWSVISLMAIVSTLFIIFMY